MPSSMAAAPEIVDASRETCRSKMEVARVPSVVARPVKRRLRRIADMLEGEEIDPFVLQQVFSVLAGIVHHVGRGSRLELADEIEARAETLRKSEDGDDAIAAGELCDLADEIRRPILEKNEET